MRRYGVRFTVPAIAAAILLLAGCASLPRDLHAIPSVAVGQDEPTGLGGLYADAVARHPGQSGFYVLDGAREAFLTRAGLIDVAERTLDLQYYKWYDDTTGRLLLKKALRAADRGVRVRLLLDDHASGGRDRWMSAIDAHPHVEVRMYNPYASRSSASFVRTLAFIGNFRRLNHRMHNKLFVADNQAAILGGRNVGDDYFGVGEGPHFVDLDLLAVGPVVADVSRSFDLFWNSDWAVTLASLREREPTEAEVARARARLRALLEDPDALPYPAGLDADEVLATLERERDALIWAESAMVFDQPRKDLVKDPARREHDLGEALRRVADDASREFLGVFPYVVPTREMLERWRDRLESGVAMSILTNSMDSTDEVFAQYGYRERRRKMLRLGIDLWELRADAADRTPHVADPASRAPLSLHAKAAVIDREIVFVGALNLDPRSLNLNTETGLIVRSPRLADRVARWIERLMLPRNSYRVELDGGGDVVWRTAAGGTGGAGGDGGDGWTDGAPVEHRSEPGFGLLRRLAYALFRLIPLDSQL